MTDRTVKFDKSIYSKRAVQESIKEYADIAEFSFAESESDYICRITVQTERHEDVD